MSTLYGESKEKQGAGQYDFKEFARLYSLCLVHLSISQRKTCSKREERDARSEMLRYSIHAVIPLIIALIIAC